VVIAGSPEPIIPSKPLAVPSSMSSSLSRTSQAGINVVRSMGLPEAVSGLSEAVAHVSPHVSLHASSSVPTAESSARRQVAMMDAKDLDLGPVWRLKYYSLFPLLRHMQGLDHYCRVLYPLAYGIVLLVFYEEIKNSPSVPIPTDSPCIA
jgi:hypothetical protein